MTKLTQNELNSIRDLTSNNQTMYSKLSSYSNQCQDSNIKSMFKKAADEAQKSAQTLVQIL